MSSPNSKMAISLEMIKLNESLDFPLASKIDEDGVRNFTNNMDNFKYR